MDNPLNSVPDVAKIGAGVVVLGGLVGVGYWYSWLPLIIVGGLIVTLLVVFAVYTLMQRRSASRGQAMVNKLPTASNAGVSKATQLAKLDSLRKEFETGVAKFRAAGRNVYTTPWYLLVGESGGGKTAAIAQSQLRFIPGLQDAMQGVGGTINMNWWFTRDAIILDTAGKLMFEDVAAGMTSEWDEFLALLKHDRALCPINGILLMIPADSLLRDTAADIEKKAGRIAQQFEHVQTQLGFRFPVFVVITKCDLVNGFNQFFESMADPRDQQQMLGWSNPLPLDTDFDPKIVDQHLATVRERLLERRMRLLMEPVGSDDAALRRIDQVDALFNLPDSLMGMAPRLQQYLETIFVAGSWSQRPLFVRGIYFTCSLQRGSPYDPDLAAAMGVSVGELPAERAWDRKRSYFLRDLFTEKIFPEKGLVTRVKNVRSYQRKRKAIVIGVSCFCLLLLLGLSCWSAGTFSGRIKQHKDFWSNAKAFKPPLGLVNKKDMTWTWIYQGADRDATFGELSLFPDALNRSAELARQPIRIPWVFRWLPSAHNLDDRLNEGSRALVQFALLRPVIQAAQQKLNRTASTSDIANNADKSPMDKDATACLLSLLQLSNAGFDTTKFDLSSVARYVVTSPADRDHLTNKVLANLKIKNNGGTEQGEIPLLVAISPQMKKPLAADWSEFSSAMNNAVGVYLTNSSVDRDVIEKKLSELSSRVDVYKSAERRLGGSPSLTADLETWRKDWKIAFDGYTVAKQNLEKTAQGLSVYQTDVLGQYDAAIAACGQLQGLLNAQTDKNLLARRDDVTKQIETLLKDQKNFANNPKVAALRDEKLLQFFLEDKNHANFAVHYDCWKKIDDALLTSDTPDVTFTGLEQRLAQTLAPDATSPDNLAKAGADAPTVERCREAQKSAATLLHYHTLMATVKAMPGSIEGWEMLAIEAAKTDKSYAHDAITGTYLKAGSYDGRYYPEQALTSMTLLGDLEAVLDRRSAIPGRAGVEKLLAPKKEVAQAYAESVRKYWRGDFAKEVGIAAENWPDFRSKISLMNGVMARNSLLELADFQVSTLRKLGDKPTELRGPAVKALADAVSGAWASMSDQSAVARRALLGAQGREQFAAFERQTDGELPSFVEQVWREVARKGVNILVQDAQADMGRVAAELKPRMRQYPLIFPITSNPPADDVNVKPDDLEAIGRAMETFSPPEVSGAAQGAPNAAVDKLLAQLRRPLAKQAPQWGDLEQWIRIAQPVVAKLNGAQCSIILDENEAVRGEYEHLRLSIGGKVVGIANLKAPDWQFKTSTQQPVVLTIPVDGALIFEFGFFSFINKQADKVVKRLDAIGAKGVCHWAPLQLLYESKNPHYDAAKGCWTCELPFVDNQKKTFTLKLSLKFDGGLVLPPNGPPAVVAK